MPRRSLNRLHFLITKFVPFEAEGRFDTSTTTVHRPQQLDRNSILDCITGRAPRAAVDLSSHSFRFANMASQAEYKDRQFLAVIGDEVSRLQHHRVNA